MVDSVLPAGSVGEEPLESHHPHPPRARESASTLQQTHALSRLGLLPAIPATQPCFLVCGINRGAFFVKLPLLFPHIKPPVAAQPESPNYPYITLSAVLSLSSGSQLPCQLPCCGLACRCMLLCEVVG